MAERAAPAPTALPGPAAAYGPQAAAALGALCAAALGLLPPPQAPRLMPAPPPRCALPLEAPGLGLRCTDNSRRHQAGDRLLPEAEAGPPARMAPERLLVAAVPIDLDRASAEELLALPGVGPALAARIQAARPLRDAAALGAILGPRRTAAVLPLCRLAKEATETPLSETGPGTP